LRGGDTPSPRIALAVVGRINALGKRSPKEIGAKARDWELEEEDVKHREMKKILLL
jgi:hypothetical protein